MSIKRGFAAEEVARQYLLKNGLKLVESNYRSRGGEIDLIMYDGDYLVFVEVRARNSQAYGGALASIGLQKQQKILRTALLYLSVKKLHDKHPIRFDVVALDGLPPEIEWIKNAFGA